MSFAVTGPLYVLLEDQTGGYVSERELVTRWTQDAITGVWYGSAVAFSQAYNAAGYCVVDENGMKVAPSVPFAEGVVYGQQGDDLTVFPAIEFIKEYA